MTRRTIRVNGERRDTSAATVAELLDRLQLGGATAGLAVAVNDAVVPRSAWAGHVLNEGDRVEVVGAVQGG